MALSKAKTILLPSEGIENIWAYILPRSPILTVNFEGGRGYLLFGAFVVDDRSIHQYFTAIVRLL